MTEHEIKHNLLLKKHLVGRKITEARYMTPKEIEDNHFEEGFVQLILDDEILLIISRDEEANGPGQLLTNISELPVI